MRFTTLHIDGKAVPKGRPRFTRTGRVYTPKTTKDWEDKVKREWAIQHPGVRLEGRLRCTIFVMGNHVARKDVDNMAKSILDGLNKYAFDDDSQVYDLRVSKIPNVAVDHVSVTFEMLDA